MVEWTSEDAFREALATTIAKSQDDRRVFELLFDRYFSRAAEAEAIQHEVSERGGGGGDSGEGGERLDMEELREQIREAIAAGDEDRLRDLARLAIAAFGRAEGSGVVGVDLQRIPPTLRLTAGAQPPTAGGEERPPIDRDQLNSFERHLRRELERDLSERTDTLPPSRPPAALDRALPTGPRHGPAAAHRPAAQTRARAGQLAPQPR